MAALVLTTEQRRVIRQISNGDWFLNFLMIGGSDRRSVDWLFREFGRWLVAVRADHWLSTVIDLIERVHALHPANRRTNACRLDRRARQTCCCALKGR